MQPWLRTNQLTLCIVLTDLHSLLTILHALCVELTIRVKNARDSNPH